MKKLLSLILAALLLTAALPAAGVVSASEEAPAGYDAHDYFKVLAFMETPCYDGWKNGEDLCENYDPFDPSTWECTVWTEDEPRKLAEFNVGSWGGILGAVDLEDCTELTAVYCQLNPISEVKVSGCTKLKTLSSYGCADLAVLEFDGCAALEELYCGDFAMESLDLSEYRHLRKVGIDSMCLKELTLGSLPLLEELDCGYNELDALDVSGCPSLTKLSCSHNKLVSLDTSACRGMKRIDCSYNEISSLELYQGYGLEYVNCMYNRLAGIDFSSQMLSPKTISVQGCGYVGTVSANGANGSQGAAQATPAEGWRFDTWLDNEGNRFSHEAYLSGNAASNARIAVFEKVYGPGDADGNGSVDTADALIVLRWALGIGSTPEYAYDSCDMDGNGSIDTTDALLILRMALGLGSERGLKAAYNAHDAEKLRAFFEQEDAEGVKNGEKLFLDYDPFDPATWDGRAIDNFGSLRDIVNWSEDGSLLMLFMGDKDLAGELDLEGCAALVSIQFGSNSITRLNVNGCGSLHYIRAQHNLIEQASFEGVDILFELYINDNRLTSLDIDRQSCSVVDLDVSNNELEELDISGWALISSLECSGNRLKSLCIPAECFDLYGVNCRDNELEELRIETNAVCELDCSDNPLTRIDIPGISIGYFDCTGCPLTYLRFDSYSLPIELSSAGHGTIGARVIGETGNRPAQCIAYATPDPGWQLDAWYDENGYWAYFYEESVLWEGEPQALTLTAVFEPADVIPGDADGNGDVDTTDALIVLRAALGIDGDPAALLDVCDMDGNGIIDTTDALLILRLALGIS